VLGFHSDLGFGFSATAMCLGRMACFAQEATARAATSAYQADVMVASAPQIARVVDLQEDNHVRLNSLRSVHIDGGIVSSPLLTKIRLLICSELFYGYGHPETGTVAYAHVDRIHGLDHAVGFAAPWVDIEIVDEARRKVGHPAEEGEVRVRTLGQGHRYRRMSETDYRIDASEWFYAGDRGQLFRNGLLVIRGRVQDSDRGRIKASPEQIEGELKLHPAIADAAVIGVLSELGVEQIWVGIVAREPTEMDPAKIYDYFKETMPLCMPDRIFLVPQVPRDPDGTVARNAFKAHLIRLEEEQTGIRLRERQPTAADG
jgi:non-ribosomal peptide synthetase component E (peptide arylation enzyme)